MTRIESLDDIRRMTAEMRRNYDNPDPRPQLRRGNPKAVSAAEMKAQLLALRGDESSPEQVAIRGYAQALREGKVTEGVLGEAATIAPMVVGMFAPGRPRGPRQFHRTEGFVATRALPTSRLLDSVTKKYLPAESAYAVHPVRVVPGSVRGFARDAGDDAAVLFLNPKYTIPSVAGHNSRVVLFDSDAKTRTLRHQSRGYVILPKYADNRATELFFRRPDGRDDIRTTFPDYELGMDVPATGWSLAESLALKTPGANKRSAYDFVYGRDFDPNRDVVPWEDRLAALELLRDSVHIPASRAQSQESDAAFRSLLRRAQRLPGHPTYTDPGDTDHHGGWFRGMETTLPGEPISQSMWNGLSEALKKNPHMYFEGRNYRRMPLPDAVTGIAISGRARTKSIDRAVSAADALGVPYSVFGSEAEYLNAQRRMGLPVREAAKGGNAPDLNGMSNFLATDRVPDTIFGIPVVSRREDYTEADLAFFRDHPEAGGYYDMGEGETPEEPEAQGVSGGGTVAGVDLPAFLAKAASDAYLTDRRVQRAGIPRMYAYENRLRSMGKGSVASPENSYKCNMFVANMFNSDGVVRWPVGNGTTPPRAGDIHVHSANVPDYLVRDDSAEPAEGMLITRDCSGEPGSYRHVGIISRSPYGAEGLGVLHASSSGGGLEWTPLDEFKSVEAKEYGLHRIDPDKYDAYMKRMSKKGAR